MKKVLLIGLDGGSSELIDKWKPSLPTLSNLIAKGIHGRIESTVPATTVPAWNSIFSGKNPGKLGIFDFVMLPFYRHHGLEVANYRFASTTYLWDILTRASIDSQFVNIPVMFPPPKIRGIAVSGGIYVPLQRGSPITYPAAIRGEVDQASGGYEASPFMDITVKGREGEYLARALRNMEKQTNAVLRLMEKHPWYLMSYVFSVIDTMQHYFWGHLDPSHPWYDENQSAKWSNALRQVYEQADKQLGRILGSAPQDTNVLIVSDHGGGPLLGHFYVNEWLKSLGFLSTKSNQSQRFLQALLFSSKDLLVGHFPRASEFLAPLFPRGFTMKLFGRGKLRDSYREFLSHVNWAKSEAYGLGGQGSIYINLKGREPNGIVAASEYDNVRNALIEKLKELRDPKNNTPLSIKVWKREDLYHGGEVGHAPDILYVIDDNKYVQKVELDHLGLWGEPDVSGGHSSWGAFIASGPDIRVDENAFPDVTVYDILPTVLHMMGLPIPNDTDGKCLLEIFRSDSEFALRRPIYAKEDSDEAYGPSQLLTEEEETEIKERLESLGYL